MLITGRFKLNFSNNTFNDTREIHGFSKDEILEIKEKLGKFKSEGADGIKINEYLRSKLHLSSEVLVKYSSYFENLKTLQYNLTLLQKIVDESKDSQECCKNSELTTYKRITWFRFTNAPSTRIHTQIAEYLLTCRIIFKAMD